MKISYLSLFYFLLLFLLSSCVPPVYDHTTFGFDEFVKDSASIAKGREGIKKLNEENEEDVDYSPCQEEMIIEGDQLGLIMYCPNRPDRVEAIKNLDEQMSFIVQDGKICLPYLAPIEVVDKTLKQVREEVQDLYCEQVANTSVYVCFKKQKNRYVHVIGTPIPFVSIKANTRLSEVLAKAELPSNANLYESYLVRQEQKIPVNFYRLIHLGDDSQNIVMQPGDQIFIDKMDAVTVMVTGEIHTRKMPIPYGFISLNELLTSVGGIPYFGDGSHIYIIRGDLHRPKIYLVSYKEILLCSPNSALLMSGDVVYIAEKPITKWNRFISELYPTLNLTLINERTHRHYFY